MAVSPDSSRPVDDATPAEAEGGASPRPDTPEEHGRLSAAAEDAARRAAEATGLPLGAWLSQVIQSAGDVPAGTRSEGSQEGPFGPRAVPIHSLRPGRFQTRESVTPEEIQVLAESIRERGVLQPILVREHPAEPGVFEIVAGERRWRGAREAGLEHVPVIVLDLDDRGAMEVALVENLQRRDLNPLEEAEGYRRLVEDFTHTQDDLARTVGKSRSHIANTLRLLRLPEEVKAMLRTGQLSAGHARALLNAADPAALARAVVRRGLNVRQTEELAQGPPSAAGAGRAKAETDAEIVQLERSLARNLGSKVTIRLAGDGGTLRIRFKGREGLDALVARLRR